MNETNKLVGRLYEESQWRRCWIQSYYDGGWVVGEVDYQSGLHYIINSDNSGQLVISSELIGWI